MDRLKIYFNDIPLYVLPNDQKEIVNEKCIVYDCSDDPKRLPLIINNLWKRNADFFVITGKDYGIIRNQVLENFITVKAAGGVVLNESNEVLLIFRKDKWDLPKGHWEPGETLEECAIREVQEETNINNPKISKFLKVTYHSYILENKLMLKECHWYLMKHSGKESLKPQSEEGIEKVLWVPITEIEKYTSQTYSSIKEVLEEVRNLFA